MRFMLGENAKMAFTTLRENKMRSFLTVLGIVIGITALISVASIVVGLYQDMDAVLNDYGPNTLFIFKFKPGIRTGPLTAEERMRKPISLDDALAIRELCPAVKAVTAQVYPRFDNSQQQAPVNARYQDREVDGLDFSGSLVESEEVFNAHPARGRFYTEAEDLHRSDVAVIGYDVAQGLFGAENPLDKEIVVAGVPYRVVGVLEKRKGEFFKDPTADKQIFVPYRAYQKHNPADDENFVGAEAYPGMMAEAEDEIRGVLRRRRNVPYNKEDNFGISSAEEIADQFRQITGSVALLIVVICSVGLLVGGVGVMNIMLMSVTQRTREIGVRKAIGARKRDVIGQFLTEAVVLTSAGGVIGVICGVGISMLINALMPSLPSSVPLWAVLLGVAASMSEGIFFGMYPAVKAARLDPVVALRYE
jgi:ABC-type antimicrobial peptide transport system permease subunit